MPSRRPFNNVKLVDAGDMTGDVVSPVTDCIFHKQHTYDVRYTDADSPVGVLSVQVSDTNVAADFVNYPLTDDMVTIVSGDGALASGVVDISGVDPGRVLFNFIHPFGFSRFKYTSTSDGIADTVDVFGSAK